MKGIYLHTLTFKKSVIYLKKVNYTPYNYTPCNSAWTCLKCCTFRPTIRKSKVNCIKRRILFIFLFLCFQSIREILLVGHRQAVAWIDDWYGMTIEDVRDYEKKMQKETNERLLQEMENQDTTDATTPTTPSSASTKKGWFNWS